MPRFRFRLAVCIAITAAAIIAIPAAHAATAGLTKAAAALSGEMPLIGLQAAMARGDFTSADLTQAALNRIKAQDGKLHAVIVLNPDALALARADDAARQSGQNLGPLMGVPILIKDNVETADNMATTAGSLALKDNISHRDAPVAARLRAAGAIIIGKTNLSEWANIRSSHAMSGWSGIGGLVKNPYDLTRTACGSSSGTGAGVAADYAVIGVGTETDGSVTCPSAMQGLVGLKPTVGLVSRSHIVPISQSQDTAGPMGHNVADVAAMLSVMAGSDPADAATTDADSHKSNYAQGLSADGLKGVRIGVLDDEIGPDPKTAAVFKAQLAILQKAGAILVDIPKSDVDGLTDAENTVMMSELKTGLNAYLTSTPETVKTRTLADIIQFDRDNAAQEMPYFQQELFLTAQKTKGLDDPDYIKARDKARTSSQARIDGLLKDNHVTVLIAPTMGPAWLSDYVYGDVYNGPSATTLPATAGYPHLTIPMGEVQGLPVGISFIGTKWSEAALLQAGYAFEQASHARKQPVLP